ncbi:hypothetical protein OIU77_024735 [Salix suchowensis]|uniref:Uncharacterized protein n=1 Tax=Salix suchowensis TaxID=1278906 RepID=A0ABQ9BTS7_9ROSI|nr:hypothetical protein OIU77_024735 [Salix suchowensis]
MVRQIWHLITSPLQICGLIFYSRKLKKGKRGDLGKKIQVNPIKVCKEGVQMLLGVGSPVPYHGTSISGITGPNFVQSDSEFSTVPLTPFDNISRISRLPTKH